EVDRVLDRQRSPRRKLGSKQLGPEPGLEMRQRLPFDGVLLVFVNGTKTRLQRLHSTEEASSRAGVPDLGLHRGDADQRVELALDQPDLSRGREPTAVELARAGEIAEALCRKAEVVERPRAPVEIAARLADRQALLEELAGALVPTLAHQLVAEVVQRDREQPRVTAATADRQRLLEKRVSLIESPPSGCDDREEVDRHRPHILPFRSLRYLEDAGSQLLAFVDVALPQREQCSAPQRVDEPLGVKAGPERDGGVQEAAPLGPVPACLPVQPDRTRQPKRTVGVAALKQMLHGSPHVCVLRVEPVEPLAGSPRAQFRAGALGERDVPRRVAVAQRLRVAHLVEPPRRELANRLEHPVAVAAPAEKALVDQ